MGECRMEMIFGEKGSGKTKRLIEMSAETGGYIVCPECGIDYIVILAESMGLKIPYPISYSVFFNGGYRGKGVKLIYIDNVDSFLNFISKAPIGAVSMRSDNFNVVLKKNEVEIDKRVKILICKNCGVIHDKTIKKANGNACPECNHPLLEVWGDVYEH